MKALVVPRAEFRVFGQGVIETVTAGMWNGKTILGYERRMPAETYILSKATSEANVKVRDGLLDIKVKTATTPEGYEVFEPQGKFRFPVEHGDMQVILDRLGTRLDEEHERWTFESFLDAVRRSADLVPVAVEKVRYGFTIDGVICEYAHVWFNGALVESACVESEHYAAMRDVIAGLGLSERPNVSYILAAKRVVGLEPWP